MTSIPYVIDDLERDIIREAFRRSARLIDLAEIYHVSEDEIADIIGLPKDPKERWEIFRDTCFYDHGNGDAQLDRRMEFYAEFLEEGDFEKWHPCCYLDHDDPEFIKLKQEAESIPKSNDPRKEVRRLWILNRFTIYKSPEWDVLLEQIKKTLAKIGWVHPDGGPF